MILLPLIALSLLIAINVAFRMLLGGFNPIVLVLQVLAALLAYRYLAKRIDRGS